MENKLKIPKITRELMEETLLCLNILPKTPEYKLITGMCEALFTEGFGSGSMYILESLNELANFKPEHKMLFQTLIAFGKNLERARNKKLKEKLDETRKERKN